MGRWQPEARTRLEQAAMELYGERGFEQTTVAEIAARAGLTERTFFRHFADKREVLFGGSGFFVNALLESVAAAPADATPMEAVAAALQTAGELFGDRIEHSRARQRIIDAHPDLQERELIKLAMLATAMASALRLRGVNEWSARFAAEAGVAVFKIAFDRWIAAEQPAPLAEILRDSLTEMKAVTAG